MNGYQKKRILGALDSEHVLSEWEWDFINSLADKGDDYELSEKENHKLNEIATKTCK